MRAMLKMDSSYHSKKVGQDSMSLCTLLRRKCQFCGLCKRPIKVTFDCSKWMVSLLEGDNSAARRISAEVNVDA